MDEKKAEPVSVYDCFIYVPIDSEATSHIVEMSFVPRGIILGSVVTILGIFCLVIVVILDRRRIR